MECHMLKCYAMYIKKYNKKWMSMIKKRDGGIDVVKKKPCGTKI